MWSWGAACRAAFWPTHWPAMGNQRVEPTPRLLGDVGLVKRPGVIATELIGPFEHQDGRFRPVPGQCVGQKAALEAAPYDHIVERWSCCDGGR